MHNGLPRCKALLFPLVRGHLEFKKKSNAKANVTLVSASTPLILQSEEGKAVRHHAAACPSCFCFKAEGQFLPSAAWQAPRPPLAISCGGAAEAAALPRAEMSLHSCSMVNFSFRCWG